jgi:hypothetical protein
MASSASVRTPHHSTAWGCDVLESSLTPLANPEKQALRFVGGVGGVANLDKQASTAWIRKKNMQKRKKVRVKTLTVFNNPDSFFRLVLKTKMVKDKPQT